jgi:uncharacterized protein (DUF608 family)
MKQIQLTGTQRIFREDGLLQIALPLGGIGTGCICLNGSGGLQDFSIHHMPATTAMPDRDVQLEGGFALLRLPGLNQTRLVEGPFPREKIYAGGLKSLGYNGGGYEGFPRFRECTFTGEYPFGQVALSDPELPLSVSLTGFNPFIPLDDVASGIPAAILEYQLTNISAQAVPYQFSYHLSHLAFAGPVAAARSAPLPGLGVAFWNEAEQGDPAYGSAALGILAGTPLLKASWLQGRWFDAISVLWKEVNTDSFFASAGLPENPGPKPVRNGGSIWLEGELQPGESCLYPIVITWYFPNISRETYSAEHQPAAAGDREKCRHPFYATQWKDATDVLLYVREHYATLRQRTQTFHDALFSSTLPACVLDAVSANLAILKSPTVLRFAEGDVWGWEGCRAEEGSCPGTCTHVWNYAQALPHLFPALERTLRQRELEQAMDDRGHVNFRAPLPGDACSHTFPAAADGQLGGVLKVYREWQISGDLNWLRRIYPQVRRSLDYCIEQWDPRRVGLIEEPHHNTYDIEFWGPEGLCSSIYLGALTAMAALAQALGLPEDSAVYAALAGRSAAAIEENLFNGEYYQQKLVYRGLREKSFEHILEVSQGENSPEARLLRAEGPKYQIGTGCLSDGVMGAWLAAMCGLETAQNPASIRSHLAAVYRYNFKPSLWHHANPQRPGFALGDEPGLLLCSWPHGGRPTLPFVYSDEVWSGIEYQVAAHMILMGMRAQGLTLVEAARSRYDGRTRNPWNEYECGSYYARALSSYGLLQAYSGFGYSAVTHCLRLAPQLDVLPFACFFSTATGWGTFTLDRTVLEIRLCEGELRLAALEIRHATGTLTLQLDLTARAGSPCRISLPAEVHF